MFKLFNKLIKTPKNEPKNEILPRNNQPAQDRANLNDFLVISQVDNGFFFVENLFKKKFGCEAPTGGEHFISFYKNNAAENQVKTVAYINALRHNQDIYLIGGFCIDNMSYRLMQQAHIDIIKSYGGIGEIIMRDVLFNISQRQPKVIWGHVGSNLSRAVVLRAGFVATDDPYLMAYWVAELSDSEKKSQLEYAKTLVPF